MQPGQPRNHLPASPRRKPGDTAQRLDPVAGAGRSSDALVLLSNVERRLATVSTLQEAKAIRDEAEGLRYWAKRAGKGLKVQNKAALIKLLAERRAGELIAALPRIAYRQGGGAGIFLELKKMRIPVDVAYRWQRLAKRSEAELRRMAAEISSDWDEFITAKIYAWLAHLEREAATADGLHQSANLPAGLHHGDFRVLSPQVIPDASVQLVLTDPPYDENSIGLYGDAAKEAARILRPGGSFIAYAGQKYLSQTIAATAEHLTYWWTLALKHQGAAQLLNKLGIRCQWKPLIWCVKDTRGDVSAIVPDYLAGTGREKAAHPWQQAQAEAQQLIEQFTQPDEIVVDFFAGSGTILAAAKDTHRRGIGFEIDPEVIVETARRLS